MPYTDEGVSINSHWQHCHMMGYIRFNQLSCWERTLVQHERSRGREARAVLAAAVRLRRIAPQHLEHYLVKK